MRGKVLRIIQALNQNPEQMSESLKNWWEMFSMVQFVQVSIEGATRRTAADEMVRR